jgi:Family of unknown function (DUF5985)
MDNAVFLLCGLTSVLCATLLLRAYLLGRGRLLLGALICFVGLAANNVILFVDEVLPSHHEFQWRGIPAVAGLLVLLCVLVVED